MSANTLDQIVNHLQFLGYEISQENNITRAKHPKKMSVVIRDYKGGILFASYNVSKDSAKSDKAGFLKFLNLLNANATVARFYADKDFDLCIEAWYPNFYEKENFGVFFEAWGTDSWTLLLANGEEALKYLK